VKSTGFAADFGTTFVYPKEIFETGTLRAAFTLKNLGSGMKYIQQTDPFPREWRLGLAAVNLMNNKLNLALDYGQQRDMDAGIYTGAEYWVFPSIALRAGYAGSHTESNGIRAGVGLKLKDVSFNYAFTSYGDLGLTHRYELSLKFGAVRPTLTPEMRKMLRQAKLAMKQGRYGEATMLLDSLISMAPTYKTFQRLAKVAMRGYNSQESQFAKTSGGTLDLGSLGGRKSTKDDPYQDQDLETLLKMTDDMVSKGEAKVIQPAPQKRGIPR
jgi:hypothetical protein